MDLDARFADDARRPAVRSRIAQVRHAREATAHDDADMRLFLRALFDAVRESARDPQDALHRALVIVQRYRNGAADVRELGWRLGLPRDPHDRRVVAIEHYLLNRARASRAFREETPLDPSAITARFGRFAFVLLEDPAKLDRWSFIKKWALQGAVDGERDGHA